MGNCSSQSHHNIGLNEEEIAAVKDSWLRAKSENIGKKILGTLLEKRPQFAVIYGIPEDAVTRKAMDSNNQFQLQLIDLLGFEQFEMVGRILESRKSLCEEIRRRTRMDTVIRSQAIAERVQVRQGPAMGQQIIVQSRGQAELRREIQKEQKRARKELNKIQHAFGEEERLELELAQMERLRLRELEFAQARLPSTLIAPPKIKENYPFVFDVQKESDFSTIVLNGFRFALPEGSERNAYKTYEEVKVPACQKDTLPEIPYVYVKDMDDLGKLAFQGFEKLNMIQSIVFEQAYKTKENLLICAPTGAGKTRHNQRLATTSEL